MTKSRLFLAIEEWRSLDCSRDRLSKVLPPLLASCANPEELARVFGLDTRSRGRNMRMERSTMLLRMILRTYLFTLAADTGNPAFSSYLVENLYRIPKLVSEDFSPDDALTMAYCFLGEEWNSELLSEPCIELANYIVRYAVSSGVNWSRFSAIDFDAFGQPRNRMQATVRLFLCGRIELSFIVITRMAYALNGTSLVKPLLNEVKIFKNEHPGRWRRALQMFGLPGSIHDLLNRESI